MRVALIHDQLTQYGGAERVLDVFFEIYPEAPVYTTMYLEEKLPAHYKNRIIKTSFIQKLGFIKNNQMLRKIFFAFGISQFYLKNVDLVISDTQGISKGVRIKKGITHISYVHTIPWYIWGLKNVKGRHLGKFIGRIWDFYTAQKPQLLLANSKTTQDRIRKYWKRESTVLYPPVQIEYLQKSAYGTSNLQKIIPMIKKEGYIVFVGRLEGYKGELELAKACTELHQNVIFIGSGSNQERLNNYSEYVKLISNADDKQKANIIKHAIALFNGSIEDFGINMAEALALGTPVIAIGKGGATEIIQNNKTGIFIYSNEINAIKTAINKIKTMQIDYLYTIQSVEKFSNKLFIQNFKKIVESDVK